MARNQPQRMPADGKDMARFLTSTITSFIQDRLLDRGRRLGHKEQCASRLAAAAGGGADVPYSDQAVLANLDWGIDALEDAVATANPEAKLARLDHAARMLHVAAMLDPSPHRLTAGVPNSYLSAWAHLNLSFLSRLQSPPTSAAAAALHALEMFAVDPFFARIDFAPELWESLFLPHMASIVGWYSEARHRIIMDSIPDAADLSFTADFDDQLFDESVVLAVRPDQADKLRELERAYADSLDRNTRMFARYYKELLTHDPAAAGKRGMPPVLPPIAEPPATPLHEVSRRIPDFVKFGPILPKSAGFSARDDNDGSGTKDEESTEQVFESLVEETEDENGSGGSDAADGFQAMTRKLAALSSIRAKVDGGSVAKALQPRKREVDSPKTPPKVSSPKPNATPRKEPERLLRLSSNRQTNPSPKSFSPADSPRSSTSSKVPSPNMGKESEGLVSGRSASVSVSTRFSGNLNSSSVDSDDDDDDDEELEEQKSCRNSFANLQNLADANANDQRSVVSFHGESEDELSHNSISVTSSEKLQAPRRRPPKDFVCPITGQLFSDPVTLETGQTFERRAIQEWLKRGNTTCPITRQLLSSNVLPKTNYVLKRLITSWMEKNPDLAQEFSCSDSPSASFSPISSREYPIESTTMADFDDLPHPHTKIVAMKSDRRSGRFMRSSVSNSPTCVISQAASESVMNELEPHISCLCTSVDLRECEAAVMAIARIWKDSKADPAIHAYLSKERTLNGFIELLPVSVNREALRTSIFILSELVSADEGVGETLSSMESSFDILAGLVVNGLAEALVLVYQLRPAFRQLCSNDLVPSLVQVIMSKSESVEDFKLDIEPKDAAIAILEQILTGGDEKIRATNALSVISANGLPALIKCLDWVEGRETILSILLSCMHADRRCKTLIAKRVELAPVLELFHGGSDSTRSICIDFISELVCLNRRIFTNQILQMIKDEGAFSSMHTLLVYLQMAPMEQQPAVASLLLQLDLLVEPRKMSIYREEAIDAIIEALRRKDFPSCQIVALDILSSLSGRLSSSGVPLIEAWLLKIAGVEQPYNQLIKDDVARIVDVVSEETMEEEERAIIAWEKRVAYVLCNHDNGEIFRALEECLRSNSMEMTKSCLVIATWLTHVLGSLPDTGIRTTASQCLLEQFIDVLQSSRNLEEKVLAALALKSFISDPDALKELGTHANRIYKPLRKLKRCSTVVADTLKAIINMPSVDTTQFWSCTELFEIDSSTNGEILSLVHSKSRLFSSHTDGTIKVWEAGRRGLKLIQEVHEHLKAVTCLHVSSSGDKLYSGSHDKTIRVWSIEPEEIHSTQVHDMKEAVQCLATDDDIVCYASHGTGAKVFNCSGAPKHVNFNRSVKSVAIIDKMLYCGCTGSSIQQVDLSKCTSSTLYSGTRKLLGKQIIHAICIQDGTLYAGGSSVDGMAGKAFSLSTKMAIGSFSTGLDIHSISLSSDFVFTGTKCGIIEVWLRERLARVGSVKVSGGATTKVTTLASDSDGEMLFSGSSDGRIQVWALD